MAMYLLKGCYIREKSPHTQVTQEQKVDLPATLEKEKSYGKTD